MGVEVPPRRVGGMKWSSGSQRMVPRPAAAAAPGMC